MILSTHQKFILDALKKLGCIRKRQLHILVRERFRQADLEITRARMDAMLQQMRMGTTDVRLDDELVWLSRHEPNYRRLEAIDVMIELTRGKPQDFSVRLEPPCLLRFSFGEDSSLKLFTVASADISPPELLEQVRKERVIWISDSGEPAKRLARRPSIFSPPVSRTDHIAFMAQMGRKKYIFGGKQLCLRRKRSPQRKRCSPWRNCRSRP